MKVITVLILEMCIKRTSHHLQKNRFKKITDLIGYILLLEKYCQKMKRQATTWKKIYPKHRSDKLYVYYTPNLRCILKQTCILNNVNPMTEIKGLISWQIKTFVGEAGEQRKSWALGAAREWVKSRKRGLWGIKRRHTPTGKELTLVTCTTKNNKTAHLVNLCIKDKRALQNSITIFPSASLSHALLMFTFTYNTHNHS